VTCRETAHTRFPQLARAAPPLPPPRPAIERPQEVHLHLHGVSAKDIAAILNREGRGGEPIGAAPAQVIRQQGSRV